MQKIKRTRKIYHKPLTLNLEGLIKPRDDRVDFQPGEKEQSKEPIRPPEWKEKPVHTGKLVMQFCGPPEMETKVPAHLTLVRAHRPPKAKETHIERALKAESLDKDFIFEEVPAGDYAVVCQVKGYRPFVRFLQVNRRKLVLPLGSPMHRVQNREEEDVLLRLFERHPFVENVRRFLTRFGYLQDHSESNYDVLDPQISAALRLFQRTFHLHATGELTVETLLLMLRPRCAFPDVIHDSAQRSSTGPTGIEANDPIVFMSDRWDSFNLRYRLFDGTTDISNEWPLIRASMDR